MEEMLKKLNEWLKSLPKDDRLRETMIADRNLKRISDFLVQ